MKTLFLTIIFCFLMQLAEAATDTISTQQTNNASKKETQKKKKDDDEKPWFVGTLLAPFPENVPPGQILIEPYLFASRIFGIYNADSELIRDRNAHLYTFLLYLETGITKKIDITFTTEWIYSHTSLDDSFSIGDTSLELGFQISKDKKGSWIPDLRVVVGESFPTGKYDHLNFRMRYMDGVGSGAFETYLIFIAQKIFYTWPKHPYNWNFSAQMTHSSNVDVSGLSIYGGTPLSQGTVSPGESFIINLAYEMKLNKHWGCGTDIHFQYQNRSAYYQRGEDLFEFLAGSPSSDNFSLAPEIEYNFNSNLGVEAGLWFSLFGRNNFAFFSGFVTLSYQF